METKVTRTRIIGTKVDVFTAWIKEASYEGSCTFTYDQGVRWTQIGTDPRKKETWKNLKGEARAEAVLADYEERTELAHRLIREAHPDLHLVCAGSTMELYN